jgi:hypothetical protein
VTFLNVTFLNVTFLKNFQRVGRHYFRRDHQG